MTKEEIKEQYSMYDIVARYNLYPNRAGFVPCPFHKEKTASMKIYRDSYYCFGCGANGDIFAFVQHMEGVSFKEAYISLGGTYEKSTFSSRLAVYRSKKRRDRMAREENEKAGERLLNTDKIAIYREFLVKSEPLSSVWCDCYNALQLEMYKHAEINGLESRW